MKKIPKGYSIKIILIILALVVGLFFINRYFLVEVPAYGGSITEGVIGTPRFINPVFAQSNPDRDLTALVYSGLVREVDGKIVPDLAESYTISPDGKEYTFVLQDDALFHDGERVKPEDVVFTITTLQDFLIKSPYRTRWEGVESEQIDARTVVVRLRQPFSNFLDNMTIGILPSHLWRDIPPEQFGFSEYNIRPIGSGPYKFKSLRESGSGIPVQYTLESYRDFTLGRPYIEQIKINFYANEEEAIAAYASGNVDMVASITPSAEIEEDNAHIIHYPLDRVFGLFFNPNGNQLLRSEYIIEAIDLAIDKEHIVDTVLHGYGSVADGPVPKMDEGENNYDPERARGLLESNGWQLNEETNMREKNINNQITPLVIALSTNNAPELKHTAELVRAYLSNIGIGTDIKLFEPGNLQQDIIRQRDYEALLFGQIINQESDLYAFWHSSQRNDPGLNVSVYTNSRVDALLEQIRIETNADEVANLLERVSDIITEEKPAVFLYNPSLIYIVDEDVKGLIPAQIGNMENRFLDVHKWFLKTEKIWSFIL